MIREIISGGQGDAPSDCLNCEISSGLALELCPEHLAQAYNFEWKAMRLMDAELDAVVKELAGRHPMRIERKVGATGTFAIARGLPATPSGVTGK